MRLYIGAARLRSALPTLTPPAFLHNRGNLPCPLALRRLESATGLAAVVQPTLAAGDAVLFSENCVSDATSSDRLVLARPLH